MPFKKYWQIQGSCAGEACFEGCANLHDAPDEQNPAKKYLQTGKDFDEGNSKKAFEDSKKSLSGDLISSSTWNRVSVPVTSSKNKETSEGRDSDSSLFEEAASKFATIW